MKGMLGAVGVAFALAASPAAAQDLKDILLPAPRTEGGMPLMQALKTRQSTRAYSARKLSPETLSNLLWAAAGVNRPDSGKRTAPSARNWQEVQVWVVLEEGVYRYDAAANRLHAVVKGDLRAATGVQDFLGTAPLELVYVADLSKMTDAGPEDQVRYSAADAAFIGENVYLFCASEGLATVIRGSVDRAALGAAMHLGATERVVLAQTVGYPAEAER